MLRTSCVFCPAGRMRLSIEILAGIVETRFFLIDLGIRYVILVLWSTRVRSVPVAGLRQYIRPEVRVAVHVLPGFQSQQPHQQGIDIDSSNRADIQAGG